MFDSALGALKLAFVGPPHAARHAGATIDHLVHKKTLADIQQRGRWDAFSSVRRYDKPHIIVKCNSKVPQPLLNRGRSFLNSLAAHSSEARGARTQSVGGTKRVTAGDSSSCESKRRCKRRR